MKKKLLAVLLTAVMVVTALAGCGSGSSGSDSSAGSAGSESAGSDSEASESGAGEAAAETDGREKVDGIMYAEGLPIVDEGAYTFSMFCDDSTEGNFLSFEEFEKQTNVKVDFRGYPYETATERMNLDLNSGDYADVIGGWILSDSMILTYGVQQGVFIPLDELFEKYAPNISAILDLPGVREEMTAPDGHIYTIPYVCSDTQVEYSPYINERWLERVGMDVPTTTDEFEAVLKAFKEQDANGNGDPNDEIPFSADSNNKHLESMAGYFGVPMSNRGFTVTEDGETAWAGESSGYREFLKWFSRLNDEGLIDSELFTQDNSTWNGKGSRDLFGCSIAYGSGFRGVDTGGKKGDFTDVPVLNADQGGRWLRYSTGVSTYRTQAVITDNAEHPEVIVRWFDNAFALENGILCGAGPIGVTVRREGEAPEPGFFTTTAADIPCKYYEIGTEGMSDEDQEKYAWQNRWPQSMPKFLPPDFKYARDEEVYDEKGVTNATYEPYLTEVPVKSFWVSQEDVEAYSELATVIRDYYAQQQAMFCTGELDVNDDAVWQAYCDGFDGLNLDKYLEICGITERIE